MTHKVVILGGGFGGLSLATELETYLVADKANSEKLEVTLIERNKEFVVGASHQFVVAGRFKESEVRFPYSKLRFTNIKFVNESIVKVDSSKQTVTTDSGDIPYDTLVSSLGASPRMDIPGLGEAGSSMASLTEMIKFRDALADFPQGGTMAVVVAGLPYKCPPAPYEFALMLNSLLAPRGSKTVLITPDPKAVPMANPALMTNTLQEAGVDYRPGHVVTQVDAKTKTLQFKDEAHAPVTFDSLCYMPGFAGTAAKLFDPLPAGLEKKTFLEAHYRSMRTAVENVYAIGDDHLSFLPFVKPGPKPTPKAGGFAEGQAQAVARSIIEKIEGTDTADWKNGGTLQTTKAQCAAEAGEDQAILISIDLYSHELTKPGATEFGTDGPSKEHLQYKINWYQDHVSTWFDIAPVTPSVGGISFK